MAQEAMRRMGNALWNEPKKAEKPTTETETETASLRAKKRRRRVRIT
jgi:hypothetical protein